MIRFILNNQDIQTSLPGGTTLLDFIRYHQHLRGTKIGCREGDCGACTVLVGQEGEQGLQYCTMTSCLMPLGNARGKHIVTVEGINGKQLTPVQDAIVEEGGTQCGFCTVGFVLSFTGFALDRQAEGMAAAVAAIDGNICRCTGYKSLERAAARLSTALEGKDRQHLLPWLVEKGYLPGYFLGISARLKQLNSQLLLPKPNYSQEIVGGGTDLLVQQPEKIAKMAVGHVFDLNAFNYIRQEGRQLQIGASVTAEDIQSNALIQSVFPNIRKHMKLVSSTPIRNMGTLAGNLVNASPIGDLTIFFLALDSELLIRKGTLERRLPLKDFYQSYKTFDLREGECVAALRFDRPSPAARFNFEKVCKRTHLDIASVNSACKIETEGTHIKSLHLSAGGVAAIPKYLRETSDFLTGRELTVANLKAAIAVLEEEISPISDARGTAAYKRLLLRQLFFAHFLELFPGRFALKALTHDA